MSPSEVALSPQVPAIDKEADPAALIHNCAKLSMFSLAEGSKGVKLMSGFKENKLLLRKLLEPGPDFNCSD